MVYTLAIWRVKPGRGEEFVELWNGLAEWTLGAHPNAHGTLVRDRSDEDRFISFGPWESIEQIEAWRGAPEFQEAVGRMREVLAGFEPGEYDLVIEAGS